MLDPGTGWTVHWGHGRHGASPVGEYWSTSHLAERTHKTWTKMGSTGQHYARLKGHTKHGQRWVVLVNITPD